MLKVATVCSGIGAPEKALKLLDIPYELAFFSEIDSPAIKSYCAIHNVSNNLNLGDLSLIDYSKLPNDIDLIVGGTPCQDFSNAGLGRGGEEGSGTRSSLMWYYVKMINQIRPRVVVWENVSAVISKKHIHTYHKFYLTFSSIGYNIHVKLLNGKYFNLPQNRVRLFLIAIRKDIELDYEFPCGYDSGIRIRDILLEKVPVQYFCKALKDVKLYNKQYTINEHRIMQLGLIKGTKFKQGNEVLLIDGIFDCLTTKQGNYIFDDRYPHETPIRHLSANESMRLMGFTDEDYLQCHNAGVSDSELYIQAGNSIAVPVLMAIFGQLYNVPWKEKVFKDRFKTERQLLYDLPLFKYQHKNVVRGD